MSFLDNLENNLKSLESQEDGRENAVRDERARLNAKASAAASAPYAEELRKGPYTAELLKQATRVGHSLRVMVRPVWLGNTLRLEARDRKLELRPTPTGIVAVYLENNRETHSAPLDLKGSPEDFLRAWLTSAPNGDLA
jgi:hypothetical protein